MEIFVWKTLCAVGDRLGKQAAATYKVRSNRRLCRHDRRRSVNDGLVVTLSTRPERRHNQDRRQVPDMQEFQLKGPGREQF